MAAINITRRILRIDDAVLIDLFENLTEIIDDGSVKTHFSVVGNNQIEELPSQLLENTEGRYSFQSARAVSHLKESFGDSRDIEFLIQSMGW
ncbi:MAG TPA: hypothetical protein VKA18_11745 [Alphaproteobacteria bacterium]|nr:hypothetical protein [Alphaproteobacteria bacterium]